MAAPTLTVEVAFNANFHTAAADRVWTDVTDYVLLGPGVEIAWGRTDVLTTTEAATLRLTLKNSDGRFTAGNTSSPYYPNVKLDRPIRVTATPAGQAASVRFVGYVDAWPVAWPAVVDTYAEAQITATSRLGRLGLWNAMRSMVVENALATSADLIFPLDDPTGSTSAEDGSGNDASPLASTGSGDEVSFGGSGAEFVAGKYLTGGSAIILATTPAVSFACTFVMTAVPTTEVTLWGACTLSPTLATTYADGRPHRYAVASSGSGTVVSAKIDNVAVAAPTGFAGGGPFTVSIPLIAGQGFTGTLRDLTYWDSELSSAQVTADHTAFNGGYGELSDVTFERIAGYLDIPLAEVNADAGVVLMGGIDTSGMAGTDALRVVETTEGGVMFDARNGDLRLIGRRARYNTAAAVTISMDGTEARPSYAPVLDRSLLRNDVTGTNAASSIGSLDAGATVSERVKNQASIDAYGTAAASVEVSAASAHEPYAAASWIVANLGEPSPRVPDLAASLLSMTAARQSTFLAVGLGDKVTLTNRPSQDSSTSASFFVEGGTETYSASEATLTWNVSPVGLEDSVLIISGGADGFLNSGNYVGY